MILRNLYSRLAAALWIGLIYATIPFVRGMREAFAARWPVELIAYAVIAVVLSAAVAAVVILRRRRPQIGLADLLWLVIVAAVVVVWTRRLMGQPEEAVHFLEYGVLGILLYRVFDARVPDPTVYVAVTLTGLLVGTVDEFIQWLVPGRFWDLRDIILNGGAVALVQIVIWRLVKRPMHPIARSSLRLLCRLAATQVLLFILCMAATPQRLNRLAACIPMPDRLTTGVDAICEYGNRYSADDRTLFRSRLSREELQSSDQNRAADLARDLDASRGRGGLKGSGISPTTDPFGYEVRIHLFARNRNLNKALEHEPGSDGHRRHMTTAWRENLILEKFFGSTLGQSSFRWGPRRRNEVEAAQDPDVTFVSRAGAHLITRVSEGQLRALMLALFAALGACGVFGSTRSRPESPTG
ncbi:MAG: VanZ family protein [Thermoanaerobaculales bacterium]|nr:VanZ family protein [Thermoanaerobaculales bacterium]